MKLRSHRSGGRGVVVEALSVMAWLAGPGLLVAGLRYAWFKAWPPKPAERVDHA